MDAVACPFCGSMDTVLVSAWGGTLLTRQHRCATCRTYFEAVRGRAAGEAGAPRRGTER